MQRDEQTVIINGRESNSRPLRNYDSVVALEIGAKAHQNQTFSGIQQIFFVPVLNFSYNNAIFQRVGIFPKSLEQLYQT